MPGKNINDYMYKDGKENRDLAKFLINFAKSKLGFCKLINSNSFRSSFLSLSAEATLKEDDVNTSIN